MIRLLVGELLNTLSVTSYHPVGWSFEQLHRRLQTLRNENLPKDHSSLSNPVILVHGIFHNSTAFYRLLAASRRRGFSQVRTIELWTSLRSIDAMANDLKGAVMRAFVSHRQHSNSGKVRVVAHSLGGMVTRAALLDPEFANLVDRVIFLGVPHQGNLYYEMPFPRCIRNLSRRSPLLEKIRKDPLPGGIEYFNLRGKLDVITRSRDTLLPHVPNIIFDNVGHAGLLSDRQVIETILAILEES